MVLGAVAAGTALVVSACGGSSEAADVAPDILPAAVSEPSRDADLCDFAEDWTVELADLALSTKDVAQAGPLLDAWTEFLDEVSAVSPEAAALGPQVAAVKDDLEATGWQPASLGPDGRRRLRELVADDGAFVALQGELEQCT